MLLSEKIGERMPNELLFILNLHFDIIKIHHIVAEKLNIIFFIIQIQCSEIPRYSNLFNKGCQTDLV